MPGVVLGAKHDIDKILAIDGIQSSVLTEVYRVAAAYQTCAMVDNL